MFMVVVRFWNNFWCAIKLIKMRRWFDSSWINFKLLHTLRSWCVDQLLLILSIYLNNKNSNQFFNKLKKCMNNFSFFLFSDFLFFWCGWSYVPPPNCLYENELRWVLNEYEIQNYITNCHHSNDKSSTDILYDMCVLRMMIGQFIIH